MRIKIVLPYKNLLDAECTKITAPGRGGSFQILPRHVDITWTLEPGILEIFFDEKVEYYAIDKGVLVKKGKQVYISVFRGIKGDSLEELNKSVDEQFSVLSKKEKEAQMILSKLETDTIRRLIELDK